MQKRIIAGDTVTPRTLKTVSGSTAYLPDDTQLVHLQFRRFAGCPVCNLHLQSVVRRHDEISRAGIREIVVFHSPAEELAGHAADLPFDVIPDPEKELYVAFGVESAPRALLNPCVWGTIVRAVIRSSWRILRGRDRGPANKPHGGRLGLPGDFLISPDGKVLAAKYGDHAYDQWSVDTLLTLAAQLNPAPTSSANQPHPQGTR